MDFMIYICWGFTGLCYIYMSLFTVELIYFAGNFLGSRKHNLTPPEDDAVVKRSRQVKTVDERRLSETERKRNQRATKREERRLVQLEIQKTHK